MIKTDLIVIIGQLLVLMIFITGCTEVVVGSASCPLRGGMKGANSYGIRPSDKNP